MPSLSLTRGPRPRWPSWLLAVILSAIPTFAPCILRAQTTNPQEISSKDVEPTFKVQAERNVVTIRVVVRNGKGEAVDNLRQEDFQLFDHGKKQTILHFSVEKPALNAAEKPSPEPSPPEGETAEKTPPAFTAPRRFVALYFDDVNTGMSGFVRARDAADRFLRASLHPGDRVGVFTSSGQKPLDFTDDLAKVHQALLDLRPHPLVSRDESCGEVTPYEAYLITQLTGLGDPNNDVIRLVQSEKVICNGLTIPPSPEEIRLEALRVQPESEQRALAALRGIESLVRLMTTLPGQRSMVIISDGFLSQTLGGTLGQISDRALHANIVINALDARGLYVGGFIADASVAGRDLPKAPDLLTLKDRLMSEEAVRETDGMGTLAQDTGGILIENNNDLEAGFRRVAAVPETSYTLGFSPENLKHDGAFHPLKVALVSAKGFSVQARKGYYAPKRAEDLAAQEKDDLQDAVFSQNEMQALPIHVDTQFFMINKTDAEIDVVTHLDLQQVHFRKEGDRNLHNLTFVTGLFDRDGHYVAGQQKSLELRLRDVSLDKLLHTGIKIETDFNVKAGTYLVRAIVRDFESGEISALTRTVEIPY